MSGEIEETSMEYTTTSTAPLFWMTTDSERSCDNCEWQQGRHFCLFHGHPMKNMDVYTCGNFKEKP